MPNRLKLIIFFGGIFLFFLTPNVLAQTLNFNIDSSYDLFNRQQLEAELIRETQNLYFYAEKTWWQSRTLAEQNGIRLALFDLGEEFKNRIYPVLTSTFGSESRPGIDKDERITVLIHQMREGVGGYSNSGDVYSRLQAPRSNEREMVYLAANHIDKPQAKSFLAHEFVHLITANQKDLLRRVTEEVWLNEARAEYAPTLLGYDNILQESNLEMRVKGFLGNPTVSLTEWLNERADYGTVNLFSQYLVDHYGVRILADSLRSSQVGIASLQEALLKQGAQRTFSQIFSEWAVALLQNDCRLGERYCYLNQNLRNLRVVPTLYFLPRTETVLSTVHGTTHWALNWHRLVGGAGNLTLEFEGAEGVAFEVPYLLCEAQNRCSVGFLVLDSLQKSSLTISDFSQKYNSLTIMPFIKSKISGFNDRESSFSFSWRAAVSERAQTQAQEELRSQLLARVAELQEQVRQLQARLAAILAGQTSPGAVSPKESLRLPTGQACWRFDNNLYFGLRNNQEVSCLQEFLKTEGVYPEALVTGNFLSLTQAAVVRFQEKYASEILMPIGLQQGTGFVGERTRAKINQLIDFVL